MVDTWKLTNFGELMYKSYRISLSDLVESSSGSVRKITGENIPVVIDTANNALHVGGTPANQMVNVKNISVLLPVTQSPAVAFPTSVTESSKTTLTISNFDPTAVYSITVDNGKVSPITGSGKFEYTAPLITNNKNLTVKFMLYASKVGKVKSPIATHNLTVIYVDVVAAAALVNADFRTNVAINTGYRY